MTCSALLLEYETVELTDWSLEEVEKFQAFTNNPQCCGPISLGRRTAEADVPT